MPLYRLSRHLKVPASMTFLVFTLKLASFIQNIEYQGPDATGQEVRHFLDVLKEEVLAIERRYDTDEGTRLDAEELICVRQFRDDICAWIGGLGTILKIEGRPTVPIPFLIQFDLGLISV
jgi:hypothetical protein